MKLTATDNGQSKPAKQRGKRGPKSKYSAAVVAKLAKAVELGASIELACGYAGIGYSTFYEWLAKETPESAELADAMAQARGKGAIGLLEKIEKAAKAGSWQAAAWMLERRHPDEYGRRRLEITGKDGGAVPVAAMIIEVPITALSNEAWADAIDARERLRKGDAN